MIPMDDDDMTTLELGLLVAVGMVGSALYRVADLSGEMVRWTLARVRRREGRS